MSVLISQKESLFPSLKSFRSSLLVRGLISRWLHVLSWQKNVRLSTQEGKAAAAESPFSPTSLAIKFKFGNMQSISWNKLALWHDQKQHPNFWSLKNFHHHTILLTSQKPNLITHSNCNIDQTVENNSKAQLIAFDVELKLWRAHILTWSFVKLQYIF